MGTEVALSFSALRTQLENEKSSLYKIDENIKKIVKTSGRFPNDRFNAVGDYSRGPPRLGGRNSYPGPDIGKNDDSLGKRKHETKTVFSRLSARTADSEGEEDGGAPPGVRRARVESTVWRSPVSRAAAVRAQAGDAAARTRNKRIFGALLGTLQRFKQEEIVLQTKVCTRNKRIFGALLGTLQRFKQEEIVLQTKEEKKAQVERKIEEQAKQQREKEIQERKTLFIERDQKKATIKALEAKIGRVQEFELWEASQKSLRNFILTKSKPHIYWLPKKMSDKAAEKLNSSRKFHEKCMAKKRHELQDELQRIEQRCLRVRTAKENEPKFNEDSLQNNKRKNSETSEHGKDDTDKGRKRDKFAMDVDEKEKEDSDGEDRHDESNTEGPLLDAKATDESKMDTSVEHNGQNSTMESETANNTSQESQQMDTETNHVPEDVDNKTEETATKPEDVQNDNPTENNVDVNVEHSKTD